ncbi:MAG: ParA family protein [Acidobacteriota bacterium]
MKKKILAVANQKGGVGKTTTVINLGASLSAAEIRVLIVDMDPQGNATSGLGFKRDEINPGIFETITQEALIHDSIIKTKLKYLDLCPSTKSLASAEIEFLHWEDREKKLRLSLSSLENKYQYILIDCPPSLGYLTLNSLVAATSVLIPLQCEYYALEGLSDLLDTFEEVRKYLNPMLELEGILLTMHDERTNLSNQIEKEVRELFRQKVFSTVIPRNVKLGEAPSFGLPIILYDIKSKGAISYMNLAKEILKNE